MPKIGANENFAINFNQKLQQFEIFFQK